MIYEMMPRRIVVAAVLLLMLLSTATASPASPAVGAALHQSAGSVQVAVRDGGSFADFEALLREQFPKRAPCVAMPDFFRQPPDGRCPHRSFRYIYLFKRSGRSTFRLLQGRLDHASEWEYGVTTTPLTVSGHVVSCTRDRLHALLWPGQQGANPDSLPQPECWMSRGSAGPLPGNSGPWGGRRFALTAQGQLQLNLLRILRQNGLAAWSACFNLEDPRTEWSVPRGAWGGGCAQYNFDLIVSAGPARSAFHLGSFYEPSEIIRDRPGAGPVLMAGRVVICGESPKRYLFGPTPGSWMSFACGPPVVRRNVAPHLAVDVAGTGGSRFTVRPGVSVFGWTYSCPRTARRSGSSLIVTAVQRYPGPGVEYFSNRYVSGGRRGQGQGVPVYDFSPTHFRLRFKAACAWRLWTLAPHFVR
jgi:hypothetical protein